ncbi:MAG TPA: MFS transporter, partial [Acidimicrobiales bacterium]|nr:MFS transporter [Acidimicrobiales bacterium]
MPTKCADDRLDRELVTLAAVLLVGAVAALLDTTVVSVALPRLSDEMGAPVATVQWVSTGYLLAMAVAIPAMGWLVDRLGSRRTWLAALWCFLAGSL